MDEQGVLTQFRLVVNHAEAHVVVLADVFEFDSFLFQCRADGIQVFIGSGNAEHGVLGISLRFAVLHIHQRRILRNVAQVFKHLSALGIHGNAQIARFMVADARLPGNLGKVGEIHIGSGNDHEALFLRLYFAPVPLFQESCQAHGSGWFRHDAGGFPHGPDGLADLIIGHGHELVNQFPAKGIG